MSMRIRRQKNIRKVRGAGLGRRHESMAADRSLLSFRSGVDTDVQSDAESRTLEVTGTQITEVRVPLRKKH